jgi:hypothetical protein
VGLTVAGQMFTQTHPAHPPPPARPQNTIQMHKRVPPPRRWRSIVIRHEAFTARTYVPLGGAGGGGAGGSENFAVGWVARLGLGFGWVGGWVDGWAAVSGLQMLWLCVIPWCDPQHNLDHPSDKAIFFCSHHPG